MSLLLRIPSLLWAAAGDGVGGGGVWTPHPVLKPVSLLPRCISWGLPPWAQPLLATFTPGAYCWQ